MRVLASDRVGEPGDECSVAGVALHLFGHDRDEHEGVPGDGVAGYRCPALCLAPFADDREFEGQDRFGNPFPDRPAYREVEDGSGVPVECDSPGCHLVEGRAADCLSRDPNRNVGDNSRWKLCARFDIGVGESMYCSHAQRLGVRGVVRVYRTTDMLGVGYLAMLAAALVVAVRDR